MPGLGCFRDLDEDLQRAFHELVKARGLSVDVARYMMDYMSNKESTEYVRWLHKLKSFFTCWILLWKYSFVYLHSDISNEIKLYVIFYLSCVVSKAKRNSYRFYLWHQHFVGYAKLIRGCLGCFWRTHLISFIDLGFPHLRCLLQHDSNL